jgi:hypothetical protein
MKRVQRYIIWSMVAAVWFLVQFSEGAEAQEKAEVSAELQRVALFKNGLGFFVARAQIPGGEEAFSVGPFAAAAHGTFWAACSGGVDLQSLIAKEIEREDDIEAISIAELLRANVGKEVKLYFSNKEEEAITGTIKSFADNRELPQPQPYAPGRVIDSGRNYGGWNAQQPNLMMVQTDQGLIAISPQNVRRVDFSDKEVQQSYEQKKKAVQLQVRLGKPVRNESMTLSYLAKGITWAPSYMVDISEADKARIAAKALIINEVCDLKDVTVSLVTGYPNLRFSDIVSPLAKKENLAQFLQALSKGESERGNLNVMSNVMRQSASYGPMGDMESVMPAYGAAQAGQVAEDLFYYPVEKVNLKKDEVGYYPLFTEAVPYKHIYQWQIPDYVNEEDYYRYDRRNRENEEQEVVWHSLRLDNTMKLPWTTAPAEIVKEGRILGQDILSYTPAKGKSTLKITRAVSLKAEQIEYETDRQRDVAQWYGSHYDLVTVKGELSVKNFMGKTVTVEISKKLSGEVKSSEPEAKVAKLARGLRRANTQNELTWTIELQPDEQKELNYIFEVYVRR